MLPLLVFASFACAEPPLDPPAARGLELLGVRVLDESDVRSAIGRVPSKGDLHKWAEGALRRLDKLYKKRGYAYARAWFVIPEQGRVKVEIDEGVMERVVFHGVSMFDAARYRMTFDLPERTYHSATIQTALRELEVKYDLAGISFRVDEEDQGATTLLGFVVPGRTLHIFPVGRESFGFDFGVHLDSTYGLLPEATLRLPDLMLAGDRFGTYAAIGVPYRKYLFDESAKFQWVHGEVGVRYRFPTFATVLAPSIDGTVAVSDDAREEVSPEAYYVLRTTGFVDLGVLLRPFALGIGAGVRYSLLFDRTEPDPPNPGVRPEIFRYGLRLNAEFQFSPEIKRRDLRSWIRTGHFFALDEETRFFYDGRLEGQWAASAGDHDFLVRGEALYLAGDVTVLDEVPLTSDYQRVTFGGRYWVRASGTLELAARFALGTERVKLGIFNDFSLFGDLRDGGDLFAMAEGFGPSLHFLILDEVAFDFFYAFGFSGDDFQDFDHNLSFSLHSVF